MDDQNKPTNPPMTNPNQPKVDEPDVTTSAPVEMEPSTNSADMPQPAQNVPVSQPPAGGPVDSPAAAPQPQEQQPAVGSQQPMLEAPKKNTMLMVGVVAAIVVVLALVGILVYQAL